MLLARLRELLRMDTRRPLQGKGETTTTHQLHLTKKNLEREDSRKISNYDSRE